MALSIGELVGYIDLDDKAFDSGLDGATEKFKGFGSKLSMAAAGLGIAAAGALAVGLVGAMDASAANDKLAAQLGLSKDQAAAVGKTAGEVYSAGFGDSMEGVNDAIRSVMQNLGGPELSGEALKGLTEAALNLSSAFGVDVTEATKAAGQMMKTGLASNATEAFDIITAGMQRGANSSDDFLDTLNEYSTQFRKMGIDGTTATGLISQGMKAGARDSDIVADAIKEFSIRAIDGSKSTAEGFKALGLSGKKMADDIAAGGPTASAALDTVLDRLRGMKDPVAQSATAVELFGTQAEDLGAALFALDPSSAVSALGEVGGAADKMGQTLNDNASANLESFKRQFETAFTNIVGNHVLPVVEKIATILVTVFGPALAGIGEVITDVVIPAFTTVIDWIKQNQDWLVIVAGAIMLLFLPALIQMGLQALISAGQVVAAWVLQKGEAIIALAVQSGVVLAMIGGWLLMAGQALIQAARMAAAWLIAMGPVGWIIAAVIGLVALIITNWEWLKQTTTDIWNAIWKWVSDRVTDVATWVRDRVNDIVAFFGWLGDLPGKVATWFGQVKDAAVNKLFELLNWLGGLPGRVLSALGDVGSWLLNAGADLLRGLWNGITGAAGWLWEKIKGFAKGIVDGILGFFGIHSPSRVFADIGGQLVSGLAKGIDATAGLAVDAALSMADSVTKAANVGSAITGGGRFVLAGAGAGQMGAGAMTGERSLVNIENYHPPANATPTRVAADLDWFSKSGGH